MALNTQNLNKFELPQFHQSREREERGMSVKDKEVMKARETEAGINKIFTLIIKALEKGQIDMRIMRDPQWIDPIMSWTAIEMSITRIINIRLKCIEVKVI
jgi:hypothetical protein